MNKIVLIGAGSTNFGLGTIGDIFKSKILEGSTIVLHDINPRALEKTRKITELFKNKLGVNYIIQTTTDRKKALKDANFCIISIEIGNRFHAVSSRNRSYITIFSPCHLTSIHGGKIKIGNHSAENESRNGSIKSKCYTRL